MPIDNLDFDNVEEWTSSLDIALDSLITEVVRKKLKDGKIELVEDARDLLFKLTNRKKVIDVILDWLSLKNIIGYHGTRLNETELVSIQREGLIPLLALNRRDRLVRVLSSHPRWNEVENKLDEAIQSFGQGEHAGRREGQVHITLSKSGLINDFNHYLIYGSEFDQQIVEYLLDEDGLNLLSADGNAMLIKVAVPGRIAIEAAHPFVSVDRIIDRGDVPNLVNEFLNIWSYRIVYPNFQPRSLKVDCGMIFWESIPASWIVEINKFPPLQ